MISIRNIPICLKVLHGYLYSKMQELKLLLKIKIYFKDKFKSIPTEELEDVIHKRWNYIKESDHPISYTLALFSHEQIFKSLQITSLRQTLYYERLLLALLSYFHLVDMICLLSTKVSQKCLKLILWYNIKYNTINTI
jgi:hypothetical protein